MNEKILKLLELIKIYNGGSVNIVLETEMQAFADTSDYQIETIDDLVEAMENEKSYWEE